MPLLNEYFSLLTEITFRHEGTVFHMAGDCLMLGFGVPLEQTDSPQRALHAAQEMLDQLRGAGALVARAPSGRGRPRYRHQRGGRGGRQHRLVLLHELHHHRRHREHRRAAVPAGTCRGDAVLPHLQSARSTSAVSTSARRRCRLCSCAAAPVPSTSSACRCRARLHVSEASDRRLKLPYPGATMLRPRCIRRFPLPARPKACAGTSSMAAPPALALAEAAAAAPRLYVVIVDAARELEQLTAELRFFAGDSLPLLAPARLGGTAVRPVLAPPRHHLRAAADALRAAADAARLPDRRGRHAAAAPAAAPLRRRDGPSSSRAASGSCSSPSASGSSRPATRASARWSAPGEFAVRGSLLDVFPMGTATPLRIDLFDEEIEAIRRFDPDTQRSLDALERCACCRRAKCRSTPRRSRTSAAASAPASRAIPTAAASTAA